MQGGTKTYVETNEPDCEEMEYPEYEELVFLMFGRYPEETAAEANDSISSEEEPGYAGQLHVEEAAAEVKTRSVGTQTDESVKTDQAS